MSERCNTCCRTALAAVAVVAWMTATAGAKIEKTTKLPMKGDAPRVVNIDPRGGTPCCDAALPPQCDGDANGDGVVDPLDAGFVLARFGQDATANCTADSNCDGTIDPLDAGYVLARFGTCGPVPECQQSCGGLANDECEGAESVTCGDTVIVDNTTATENASDPAYSCHALGEPTQGFGTLWYTFEATSAFATVSTCNSTGSVDTLLAIYEGACGSLVEIGCNDDAGCGAVGFNSEVSVSGLTVGQTYTIQVSSWEPATLGEITLETSCEPPPAGACCGGGTECTDGLTALECQTLGNAYQGDGTTCDTGVCNSPVNDDCANATEVFDGVTAFDTTDATDDGPADCTADTGHQDIWFTYVVTGFEAGALRVSLCDGTAHDSTLSVYDGVSCVGALLACSDDDCGVGGGPSEVIVPLGPDGVSVGDTVLIRVGGWNDLGGNANPSGAGQITIDYVTGGDCCIEHGPPGCDFIDVPDVDPADVEACVCGVDPFCCEVTWDEACLFIVENNCGIECPLCPSVGVNDECVCATPVSCGDTLTEEIVDFSSNTSDPVSDCEVSGDPTDCPLDGGGPYTKDASWWYLLTTGPDQTSLHLSMCSTSDLPGFDTVVSIWDADLTCDGFVDQQEVGCDDDFCTCDQEFFGPSDVCADVLPNHNYYILVDHYSGTGVCDGPGCFYTLEIGCDDGCVDH